MNNGAGDVEIFDTVGTALDTIPGALVNFHQGNYIPSTDDLYVLTASSGIDRFNLTTKTRTSIFSAETVSNFDLSSDGKLMAVVTSTGLYAINSATFAKNQITTDVEWEHFFLPVPIALPISVRKAPALM